MEDLKSLTLWTVLRCLINFLMRNMLFYLVRYDFLSNFVFATWFQQRGINMLFVLGGNGTHAGANAIHEEVVNLHNIQVILGLSSCKFLIRE